MVELSIEQKAKRYDEALENARQLCAYPTSKPFISDLEDLFPELKKSDNESIRKALLEMVNDTKGDDLWINYNVHKEEATAWLEKQLNDKTIHLLRLKAKAYDDAKERISNAYNQNRVPIGFINEIFPGIKLYEKQAEQKSTDKVEPKFKAGDWIIFNGITLYINEVVKGYYRTISKGGIPNSYDWDIDNAARLWTLQDAKNGDVLYFSNETIVIFKDLYNKDTFHSYCHIENGTFDVDTDELPDWWEAEGFHPATKQQCDILFAKMKEAGYRWDTDNKKPIKL